MRYEELPGPLEGWTYDEQGTIYTASGYRCDARHIEAALWLFGCFSIEASRFLIHSDEAADALRPVYELSDLTANAMPTRIRQPHRAAPARRRTETSRDTSGNANTTRRTKPRGCNKRRPPTTSPTLRTVNPGRPLHERDQGNRPSRPQRRER